MLHPFAKRIRFKSRLGFNSLVLRQFMVSWCNGSTADCQSVSGRSILPGTARFVILDIGMSRPVRQPMKGVAEVVVQHSVDTSITIDLESKLIR